MAGGYRPPHLPDRLEESGLEKSTQAVMKIIFFLRLNLIVCEIWMCECSSSSLLNLLLRLFLSCRGSERAGSDGCLPSSPPPPPPSLISH